MAWGGGTRTLLQIIAIITLEISFRSTSGALEPDLAVPWLGRFVTIDWLAYRCLSKPISILATHSVAVSVKLVALITVVPCFGPVGITGMLHITIVELEFGTVLGFIDSFANWCLVRPMSSLVVGTIDTF